MHEPDAILRDLRALGVGVGDVLMVHVSLRALGPVRGGADALVGVLDRAVGPSGTVLVTLGALDDWDWVNDEPEAEREALLAGSPPFDAATTRADPDVGVFAEAFRTTAGTVVSDHPEGRFGARGRLAAALTTDVPWHHYYGPGSPLDRFVAAGGRVLRLGADDDTTTLIHLAENLAPLPGKFQVRRHRVVHGPHGPVIRTIDCLDDSDGIASYEGVAEDVDEFAVILADYLATGRPATGTVGDAASALLDGGDLVRFAVDWIVARAVVDPSRARRPGQRNAPA
jgi:aminoglycoside N3'-acetyltransferase